MAGRHTKLTGELHKAYLAALKRTWFLDTAADLVGVHRVTIYKWLKRGRRDRSGIYHAFCNAVKKALAEAEAEQVEVVREASKDQWQASAWLLERRHPERWSSVSREMAEVRRELNELRKQTGASNSPPAESHPSAEEEAE